VITTEPAWRARWWASTTSTRVLSVAAAVLLLAAMGVGVLAGQTHPRRYQRTVYATAPPGPVTVDAAGCPVRVRCAVLAQADPATLAAVRRAFPGADVVSSVAVRDAGSGRLYRRVVVARSDRTTLIVSAQCIPGASSGPRRVLRGAPGPAVAGSLVTYSHRLQIIVPGGSGCSASVEADVSGVPPPNEAPVFALAADPAMLVTA
jgi:hypothetical protein